MSPPRLNHLPLELSKCLWLYHRGSQLGVMVPTRVHLEMSGNIFHCHNLGCGTTGIWCIEARDETQHRTAPSNKELSKTSTMPRLTPLYANSLLRYSIICLF